MFVKMSLRDRRVCFADFDGMTLPAVSSCYHYPIVFLEFVVPHFCSYLKTFLPLTTSAISDTANFNKAAPRRFAAGTMYLRRKGNAVLPITCASALNPVQPYQPKHLDNGISTCLEAIIL